MPIDDLPIEAVRSVEEFLKAMDKSAPGLVTGYDQLARVMAK